MGDPVAVALRRRLQHRDLPRRHRGGAEVDAGGRREPRLHAQLDLLVHRAAAGDPQLPAGARQQPRQPRQDDEPRLRHRRAGADVRLQGNLVRRDQRARDDDHAAHHLYSARRGAGRRAAPARARVAHPRLHPRRGPLMLRLRDAFSLPLVSASEGALRNWRRTDRAGLAGLLVIFVCSRAYAATVVSGHDSIPTVLWRWAPLLLWGFLFNLVISALSMAVGTAAGVPLGILQMSPNPLVSRPAWLVTQFFRNAPWLVLLFICVYLLPFELRFGLLCFLFLVWVL